MNTSNLLQVRTTTPTTDVEPLTLEEAMDHLSATEDQKVDVRNKLIQAREMAERHTRRTLRTGVTRVYDFRTWETEYRLDWPPLQSVTSVQYYDVDNTLQTVTASGNYDVELSTDNYGRVRFRSDYSHPTLNSDRMGARVVITAVTGYATRDDIPAVAKAAIGILLKDIFDPPSNFVTQSEVTRGVALRMLDDIAHHLV